MSWKVSDPMSERVCQEFGISRKTGRVLPMCPVRQASGMDLPGREALHDGGNVRGCGDFISERSMADPVPASRMPFSLERSLEILRRTPGTLRSLLLGLGEPWIRATEGPGTWSPDDIVGHLIHADKTNWLPRVRVILDDGPKAFPSFEREAMLRADQDRPLEQLLDEFAGLREASVKTLVGLRIGEAELGRIGLHPDFGAVTLRQLLSTWTVHDLDHLHQVTRVLAVQYREAVGPWLRYLRVLRS